MTFEKLTAGVLAVGAFLWGNTSSHAEEGSGARAQPGFVDATARLAEMVLKRDEHLHWNVTSRGKFAGCDYVVVHLVSQVWQDVAWKHTLYILRPEDTPSDESKALMLIAGGSWKTEWGEDGPNEPSIPREAMLLASVAQEVKTPVAILKQVPFQPMLDGLKEDALIAHTFQKFIETSDPNWPLLPVMARAASTALDAVVDVSESEWNLNLDGFTVTGASKRGWTTYLLGATDPRVKAIAPMVIDMLNLRQQMVHQVNSWGAYSSQIEDYTRRGLQQAMAGPDGKALLELVDPYEHREALTMPKLILLGANDPYWPADATQHYFDQLPGPKLLLNIPNNNHGLSDIPRIVGGVSTLHRFVRDNRDMPQWEVKAEPIANGLRLRATCDEVPSEVAFWRAESSTRDLRSATWVATPVTRNVAGYWTIDLTDTKDGSTGGFLEARYETGGTFPLSATSQIYVVD
ncbi:PhoPQ-activated pathogenicity-related family protein [Rhodopirellula sp. JC740]|uniref:PhoPQ-activated pathogenicity-related family protein n=1 Tax=Rhodopirellula halodulae TaxID=2894198 RepID=A0ABS8NLK5_9BACT|nr:PhoPQ-activated protein PqaA family protein [Rhodopirellula sp. JC740]MCC9643361.1 PhoPQ-activated pathogenicity-related family protein [Rhodopirellula sp. JC740]